MSTRANMGWWFWWMAWCALVHRAAAAEFVDLFDQRQVAEGDSGVVVGSSLGTTVEVGEPRHGKSPGGHSVWVSWVAPAAGLMTLTTEGSSFDTVLAVYRLKSPEPGKPAVQNLERVSGGDDEGGGTFSVVEFGAKAGERYEIAVDGYQGAAGAVRMGYRLERVDGLVPTVTSTSVDQAVRLGDTVTMSLGLEFTDGVEIRWYFNGVEIDDQKASTLVIANVRESDLGRYQARIRVRSVRFFTEPIELQVNTEGQSTALARNKLLDASSSRLRVTDDDDGEDDHGGARAVRRAALAGPAVGVVRGYNGAQIFSTLYATRDPQEPQHCGVAGGTSYWFAYRAPTNGVVTLNTDGSSYDTVLAVYEVPAGVTAVDYTSLVAVGCDDNSGANAGSSRVKFAATGGRIYYVVVDGVNGARGTARLNYLLEPTPVIVVDGPVLELPPSGRTLREGEGLVLEVRVRGTEPLAYQWLKDGVVLAGQTSPVLLLVGVRGGDGGWYSVRVSNAGGALETVPAEVRVLVTPTLEVRREGDVVMLEFPVWAGLRYVVEESGGPGLGSWVERTAVIPAAGGTWRLTNELSGVPWRFYRVRVE